ncbi:hypothetical protein L208DRAFT_1042044, partial [Tricholoma matsutake]
HIHENPVEKLDTIAQTMILLGTVCHVIIGLRKNPCNFIINIVTMMVQMAMGTRLTTNAEGEDAYDENQCSILKQLPTSLQTALNKFNIDGQTTTLATCPSCNYTHKP